MPDQLTSYAELAEVIISLPVRVREKRRACYLSLRGAAEQLGVSCSTLLRIEQGEDFNSRILPDLLRWLGRSPGEPVDLGKPDADRPVSRHRLS